MNGLRTWIVLAAGLAACAPSPDEDELMALLRDGDLDRIAGALIGTQQAALGAADPLQTALGDWSFDDCNPDRTQLMDSTANGNTAYRAVAVSCVEGVSGLGVAIAAPEDIVYVPDQPSFTFEQGVTVAAWVKPAALGATRTIIRKRDKGTSSFALLIDNNDRFRWVVRLGDTTAVAVTSRAPAALDRFQHVAGTYDGSTLRLYVDGHEVAGKGVAGSIPLGPGPLLIGNDAQERRFAGVIDNAHFQRRGLAPDEVLELLCVRATPSMIVTPAVSAPTPAGATATFDLAVTNHNSPECAPIQFGLTETNFVDGVALDPGYASFFLSPPVPSGETTHFTATATPMDGLPGGTYELGYNAWAIDGPYLPATGTAELVVVAPTASQTPFLCSDVTSMVTDTPGYFNWVGAWFGTTAGNEGTRYGAFDAFDNPNTPEIEVQFYTHETAAPGPAILTIGPSNGGGIPRQVFTLGTDAGDLAVYVPELVTDDCVRTRLYVAADGSTYHSRADHNYTYSPDRANILDQQCFDTFGVVGPDLTPEQAFVPEHLARAAPQIN